MGRIFNKLRDYLIYPLILIILWVILSLVHIYKLEKGFSVLSFDTNINKTLKAYYQGILPDNKVTFEFTAVENYLGIVAVHFESFNRLNSDKVVFRIKQLENDNWYYENTYNTREFVNLPLYPFGFPVIDDAQGKKYYVEIESLYGTDENSIGISRIKPQVIAKYKYPTSKLMQNKDQLAVFLSKKFLNIIQKSDTLFSSLIYLFPLIFYLLWQIMIKNLIVSPEKKIISLKLPVLHVKVPFKVKPLFTIRPLLILKIIFNINPYVYRDKLFLIVRNKHSFLFITILGIILDIFIVKGFYDLVLIVISFLAVITIRIYRYSYSFFYKLAILFLFISLVLALIGNENWVEKNTIWVYIFLFMGIVQNILVSIKNGILKE